jgi:light-regulated signal transduction histidine kinase (bacteriophytochrome)
MERELARGAAELQRVHDELQQFSHIVAHDLNEPLRTMRNFATLLASRYHGQLDATADEYISFFTDAAQCMQQMLTDLLAYTRVGRPTGTFTVVGSEALLTRVLSEL